jgi:hypothetical protein
LAGKINLAKKIRTYLFCQVNFFPAKTFFGILENEIFPAKKKNLARKKSTWQKPFCQKISSFKNKTVSHGVATLKPQVDFSPNFKTLELLN